MSQTRASSDRWSPQKHSMQSNARQLQEATSPSSTIPNHRYYFRALFASKSNHYSAKDEHIGNSVVIVYNSDDEQEAHAYQAQLDQELESDDDSFSSKNSIHTTNSNYNKQLSNSNNDPLFDSDIEDYEAPQDQDEDQDLDHPEPEIDRFYDDGDIENEQEFFDDHVLPTYSELERRNKKRKSAHLDPLDLDDTEFSVSNKRRKSRKDAEILARLESLETKVSKALKLLQELYSSMQASDFKSKEAKSQAFRDLCEAVELHLGPVIANWANDHLGCTHDSLFKFIRRLVHSTDNQAIRREYLKIGGELTEVHLGGCLATVRHLSELARAKNYQKNLRNNIKNHLVKTLPQIWDKQPNSVLTTPQLYYLLVGSLKFSYFGLRGRPSASRILGASDRELQKATDKWPRLPIDTRSLLRNLTLEAAGYRPCRGLLQNLE